MCMGREVMRGSAVMYCSTVPLTRVLSRIIRGVQCAWGDEL